jgi:hypothetical protein
MALLATDTPALTGLWLSHDQMQTWQRVSPEMNIGVLSINPGTGQLVQFGGFSGSTVPLEESADDGQHWRVPGEFTEWDCPVPDFTASARPTLAYLRARAGPRGPDGLGVLECSLDGGRTWTERPRLVLYEYNGYITQFPQVANEFAVGQDGTIFAEIGEVLDSVSTSRQGSTSWPRCHPLAVTRTRS